MGPAAPAGTCCIQHMGSLAWGPKAQGTGPYRRVSQDMARAQAHCAHVRVVVGPEVEDFCELSHDLEVNPFATLKWSERQK